LKPLHFLPPVNFIDLTFPIVNLNAKFTQLFKTSSEVTYSSYGTCP